MRAKSAKVRRQKREPKVKGQNKSLNVSSLPFSTYFFFSVIFFSLLLDKKKMSG
jgi:hypothetical protein